ncbi:hypothetical protein PENANT_c024G07339 [Penicillium antarcticum]|uniref:Uncharacterized protein n=1 Tax=Penicillium antarcticum TaxID=416450 RepID=A0A1V6PZX4_9EURO|nr:hypothetical protein PENANT_c024G07339 [Penicillium antarcticum]
MTPLTRSVDPANVAAASMLAGLRRYRVSRTQARDAQGPDFFFAITHKKCPHIGLQGEWLGWNGNRLEQVRQVSSREGKDEEKKNWPVKTNE